MFNLFKKTLCITLAMLMLLCVFASCKKDDEEDPVKASGEIGAAATENSTFRVWTGEGKRFEDTESTKPASYDELKTKLAEGGRLYDWLFRVKDVEELEDKKPTKVSFTLEADRKVTLTVAARYTNTGEYSKKTITLEANKAQTVELELTSKVIDGEQCFFVEFWRFDADKDDKRYVWNTADLATWSQTVYKVTDFKVFCE